MGVEVVAGLIYGGSLASVGACLRMAFRSDPKSTPEQLRREEDCEKDLLAVIKELK